MEALTWLHPHSIAAAGEQGSGLGGLPGALQKASLEITDCSKNKHKESKLLRTERLAEFLPALPESQDTVQGFSSIAAVGQG